MKAPFQKIPEQVPRLAIVVAVLVLGGLGIRMMLPDSLTERSYHVSSTEERERGEPLRYAGAGPCADCHDEAGVVKEGYHHNLSCETCHGPALAHVENPMEVKPRVQRMREFCTRCHLYNPSRPTGFPQINPAAHNPLKACIGCHDPHDPTPPTTPHECAGCHAEIARTKSLSPHVLLECTTCHRVPEKHRVTPREVAATIPADRTFCGKCHAEEAANPETPKVNLAEHGEKYLCWQCHYPHMPEVE